MIGLGLLLQGAGDFASGQRAYAEGRFGDAQQAFAAVLAAAGDAAPAELCYDLALASLQAGDLAAAEAAAERAAARGGPSFAPRRQFLRGNIAYARCLLAEAQAMGPEAEPFAFEVALQHGNAALRHWQQAVLDRGSWPAAARNVERAHAVLSRLRDEQAAAALKRRDRQQGKKPEVHLVPQGGAEPEAATPTQEQVDAKVQRTELLPAEVLALLARVQQKERDKLQLRQQQRSAQQAPGERDW